MKVRETGPFLLPKGEPMSEIRIKSEEVPSTSKKAKGETLDLAQLRAELKAEIMKELLGMAAPGQAVPLGETPLTALADLVRKQASTFKDKNPVVEGQELFELRRGEKLVRMRSKQDGTKVFDYLGRITKSDFAKQEFEKAKKQGKLIYR
jgi:hypothetical protein